MAAATTAAALALPAGALASTDPVFANSVANSSTLAGATAVAASGNFAYATSYGSGQLTAVDLSNPAAPVLAGSSTPSTNMLNASGITIANGFAYVASKNRNANATNNDDGSGNSLTILDIHTDPAQPVEVGHVHDGTNLFGAYGIAVSGGDAFIAAQGCLGGGQPCPIANVGDSFSTIDVSDVANPARVATLHNNSLPAGWQGTNALKHADSVAVSNGFAYVTAFNGNRLTVLDVSTPSAPRIVASLVDPAITFPNDVAVQGNYAYLADQNSAVSNLPDFNVVDISNPATPKVVASLVDADLAGAYRIHVSGDFAYVAASSATANDVIDISDPLHPRLVWRNPDSAHLWHSTGVSLDSSGAFLIGSSPFQMGQNSPVFPPFPVNTGTVSTVALEPAPISVSILAASEPPATTTSTTANFQFTAGNTVETVQCRLDTEAFAPCTTLGTQQYAGLLDGSHTFTVEGIGPAGDTTTAAYTWTVGDGTTSGGPVAPANTALPTIAGTPTVGQQLTAGGGTWSGSPVPTLTYQWQRCNAQGTGCTPIAGAAAAAYQLTSADLDATVEVVVTATNSAGTVPATSPATAVVKSTSQQGTGPSGPTGPTGKPATKAKVEKLTVSHSHGSYVLHLTLSAAATVRVTLRRTAPRRAVVETTTKKVAKGSSAITLKLRASTAAAHLTRYEAVVKAPGGTKHLTFSVRR